ncbi:polynucleotide 5'-hydroxyl-kinase NOL9-like [Typha angustifolia]|uniref:polynucleotide 5'-hydroxyl-kinase NOL9-like n=1 Tax=Typha angustifolia TaxID=59011 RepID=UPI003C30AE00
MPPQWEETAEVIAYDSATWLPPIVLVCGPGNSGNSTFSRLLLNTLLKRYKKVGYLDTDVGQPEFTPPVCVSLHIVDGQTADLTILCWKDTGEVRNLYQILFSYQFLYELGFLMEASLYFSLDSSFLVMSERNPEAHLNYIFRIYDYFLSEYSQFCKPDSPGKPMLPLIINTSGWVKGIGYDMLVEVLQNMYPTNVVSVRTSLESKNLPCGMFWLDGKEKAPVNLIEICGNSSILPYIHSLSLPIPMSRIIRAVDFSRRRLYVITPVPHHRQLGEINILLPGSVVLPGLLQVTVRHKALILLK